MLTATEHAAYRRKLLDLLERRDRNRAALRDEALRPAGGETSGGLSNVPAHPADLGSHTDAAFLDLGLLEAEDRQIAEINAALARLDQHTFGRCEACGRPIPRERLNAVPYARCCLPCAQERERSPTP